jgi:hypothetical protein
MTSVRVVVEASKLGLQTPPLMNWYNDKIELDSWIRRYTVGGDNYVAPGHSF